ncbi:MAG: hypothetical protein E6K32_08005 [Gammaproteobacteria bacterium]|nr:MAG: hypothetical protein E6K32_08005 [Gammaproteobacteria bacterium]
MKGSILFLTGTTLALAATCAALLHQVSMERARAQAEATLRQQWEFRFKDLYRSRSNSQLAQSVAPASTTAAQQDRASPAPRPSESAPAARSANERFLALLATPAGHSQLLAEGKLDVRRHSPDLAKALRLTPEQENQILGAEVEQALKDQARAARCGLDPACSVSSLRIDMESYQRPIKDLLGAEKFSEYKSYRKTVSARLQVRELRARLSAANALSDEQADALVAAIHEEGERFGAEAHEMGRNVDSFGSWTGSLMAATEGTGNPPSDSEILSSAREFAHRVRERVAEVLTTEQMREFDQIQEAQLVQYQRILRLRSDARPSGQ